MMVGRRVAVPALPFFLSRRVVCIVSSGKKAIVFLCSLCRPLLSFCVLERMPKRRDCQKSAMIFVFG
jgi:hypothetical protein